MIYTCLDMVRDCRQNREAGWGYLISFYVPVLRRFLEHSYPDRAQSALHNVLTRLKDPANPLWSAPGPSTERDFVSLLLIEAVRFVEDQQSTPSASVDLDLDILTAAFTGFTAMERQFVWFDTLRFNAAQTALILNLEPASITAARDRAEEALRTQLDHWKRGLLAENALPLRRAAQAAKTDQCLPAKAFLDIMDGRIAWSNKRDYESHIESCWHCVDHSCRIREADFHLAKNQPLSPGDAAPLRQLLNLPEEKKKSLWARLVGQ